MKCNSSKSSRICLFNVGMLSLCPPFQTFSWCKCSDVKISDNWEEWRPKTNQNMGDTINHKQKINRVPFSTINSIVRVTDTVPVTSDANTRASARDKTPGRAVKPGLEEANEGMVKNSKDTTRDTDESDKEIPLETKHERSEETHTKVDSNGTNHETKKPDSSDNIVDNNRQHVPDSVNMPSMHPDLLPSSHETQTKEKTDQSLTHQPLSNKATSEAEDALTRKESESEQLKQPHTEIVPNAKGKMLIEKTQAPTTQVPDDAARVEDTKYDEKTEGAGRKAKAVGKKTEEVDVHIIDVKHENTLVVSHDSLSTSVMDGGGQPEWHKNTQELQQKTQATSHPDTDGLVQMTVNVEQKLHDVSYTTDERVSRKADEVSQKMDVATKKLEMEEAKKKEQQRLETELLARKMKEAEGRPVLYKAADRKPKDCYELYQRAPTQTRNGAYKVFVVGLELYVTVYCDMREGGWTVILRREDGAVDFYRGWDEYRNGFGAPFSEHYLGNEAIHYLTNQAQYSLKVVVKDWAGEARVANYAHFWVDNEDEGFKLHVLGYSGTAGDGLSKHDGMKFSTHDVDNDLLGTEMGGSCARRFRAAGWYYKCYMSNLMGVHYEGGVVPGKKFDGVAWKPWKGPNYSMKEVKMMIRPVGAQ